MTESTINARGALAAAVAAGALVLSGPAPAQAAPLKVKGKATVTSVDGPGLLTLKVGRRTLPVRLTGIDLPAANECGGEQATQALRGLVARAPGPLAYALRDPGRRRYERAADGRLLAHVSYAVRRRSRDLASDLVTAGWARNGEPVALDAPLARRAPLPEGTPFGDRDGLQPTVGIARLCGGMVHHPAGAPLPAGSTGSPAPWTVDEHGVTTAIGSLALSATLSPAETLTVRRLAAQVPLELTGGPFGTCFAYAPTLQVMVWSQEAQDQACGDVPILLIASGPAATIVRGGKVGDPVASLKQSFPRLDMDFRPGGAWLSGDPERQWAWQTIAEYSEVREKDRPSGTITSLLTYQSPSGPES